MKLEQKCGVVVRREFVEWPSVVKKNCVQTDPKARHHSQTARNLSGDVQELEMIRLPILSLFLSMDVGGDKRQLETPFTVAGSVKGKTQMKTSLHPAGTHPETPAMPLTVTYWREKKIIVEDLHPVIYGSCISNLRL